MVLHWLIAACIIAMVPMGWWMSDAILEPESQQTAYRLFQLHKSIGILILALTAARLAWRLTHRAPPLPPGMKAWERFAAHGVHAAFYALLIAMPLSGWIYVSTGWSATTDQPLDVATSFFGLFQIPHLSFVADAAQEARRDVAFGMLGIHELIAWGAVGLFVLHVGAALKHQFLDRDGVMGAMVPWLKAADPQPSAKKGKGGAAVLAGIVLIVALWFVGWSSNLPDAAPEAGEAESAEQAAEAPADAIDTSITPGSAQEWAIDREASAIEFSGTHAGNAFDGHFADWEGHVWFDPEDLAGSKAIVLVRTGSVSTGDATQEGSLRLGEWFDPNTFPVARFEADTFRALGGDRFEAEGTLALKGSVVPVVLPFSFSPSGDGASVEGSMELDRTALDLGMESDPGADWVSQMIGVTISVSAQKK